MNYYNEIKEELLNNNINKKVKYHSINKSDLSTYYNVGRMINEDGKQYGEGIIKKYSKRLTTELGKGYTESNLKRFRQFYIIISKGATMSHQLSWSHYVELIPLNNINYINYYILETINNSLTVRQLRLRIKNEEYERLNENTKYKITNNKNPNITDYIKNPILIKSSENEKISEKVLQKLILEDIESFMRELGNSFSYIDNEYKIKIGQRYNYIDLLLFNYEFNCFVVIELKVTELKKQYIGQIQIYMDYIDKNIRKSYHDKTIGIIIYKRNNEYIIEYCSNKKIISREYKII